MGLSPFSGCMGLDGDDKEVGNPNPHNFAILNTFQVKTHVVAVIRYPDCTNFGGRKILVFKDISVGSLKSQSHIDPHFSDAQFNRQPSPTARFAPTEEGLALAINCALML